MIVAFLLVLTVASCAYWVIACWWVFAFFRTSTEPSPDFTPPVSILKPVRGLDYEAYENFVSFCQQDYPTYELLFGVDDPADPAVPLVRRLQHEFPHLNIRLIVAPVIGFNRKASILHTLAREARYEVLVLSDSDMRVTPTYLRRVVAPLRDECVGLVTCPYRGEMPVTFTAKLEALYMGVTFLPSVIVARRFLKMRFAMGATNAVRRRDLKRIGGFAAFADYLADDYQLGVRIANLGMRVHLSDYIVSTILGATTFREQWQREVRWAHCNRISRPMEYPGLILSFSTPLALLLLIATGLSRLGWTVLLLTLLLRWTVAWLVTIPTHNAALRRHLIWLPVRDMLTALIWCAGLLSRRVMWRGEAFVLEPGGLLRPLATLPSAAPATFLKPVLETVGQTLNPLLHSRSGPPLIRSSRPMVKVLIATHNRGKLREYADLLADVAGDLAVEWLSLDDVGISAEAEETGTTMEENARLKALTYARLSGLLTLADDSGLEVDALGGAPGVQSARFGGPEADDGDRIAKLLALMQDVPPNERGAQFRCVIAVSTPQGEVYTSEGVCRGQIAYEPRGTHGFGYDPIFHIPGLRMTLAEAEPRIKNRISHRARAVEGIKPVLRDLIIRESKAR